MKRRQFLKQTIQTAGYATFASSAMLQLGCAGFDKVFFGEEAYERNQVVILGAGVAGLVCAQYLSENSKPFRVFELSSRPGGRIYSVTTASEKFQTAELGAQFIGNIPRAFLQKRRLNTRKIAIPFPIGVSEKLSEKESNLFWKMHEQNLQNYFKIESSSVLQSSRLSQKSAEDVLRVLLKNTSKQLSASYKNWSLHRWGVSTNNVNADVFFSDLKNSGLFSKELSFLPSGYATLTDALYEQASGAVKSQFFSFDHKLIAIDRKADFDLLTFETPLGIVEQKCYRLICTLPLSSLRTVKGWEKLFEYEDVIQSIDKVKMAQQSRHIRFLSGNSEDKNIHDRLFLNSQFSGFVRTESGRGARPSKIEFNSNGPVGEEVKNQSLSQLAKMGSAFALQLDKDWNSNVGSWGSIQIPQQLDLSKLEDSQFKRWKFAGEGYSNSYPGTVYGAIQTAQKALFDLGYKISEEV